MGASQAAPSGIRWPLNSVWARIANTQLLRRCKRSRGGKNPGNVKPGQIDPMGRLAGLACLVQPVATKQLPEDRTVLQHLLQAVDRLLVAVIPIQQQVDNL